MKTTYRKMWLHWHIEILRDKYPNQGSNIPELLELGFNRKAIVKKANSLKIKVIEKFKDRTPLEKIFYYLLNNALSTSRRTKTNRINKEDIDELVQICVKLYNKQNGICALRGIPLTIPDYRLSYSDFYRANCISIDRIDSKISYIESNIEIVHKDANFSKQDYSKEYYLQICKEVVAYNARNNTKNLLPGMDTVLSSLMSVDMVGLHY